MNVTVKTGRILLNYLFFSIKKIKLIKKIWKKNKNELKVYKFI